MWCSWMMIQGKDRGYCRISGKTMGIVMQNIVFALGVKFVVLAMGSFWCGEYVGSGFCGCWCFGDRDFECYEGVESVMCHENLGDW